MKTHFVLIDFENVQPRNMGLLKGGPFHIKVFLGSSQGKISLEMAQALQTFGEAAEYIQVVGNGKDALDFHIAYYIGKLAAENPGASFSIISRDTGFDPLVKHLKLKQIECKRSASVTDIPQLKSAASALATPPAPGVPAARTPAPKARATTTPTLALAPVKPAAKAAAPRALAAKPATRSAAKPLADSARMTQVLENLGKRQGLPATLKTLRTTIASLFKPTLADSELDGLIAEMKRRGKIIVTGTKVAYALA